MSNTPDRQQSLPYQRHSETSKAAAKAHAPKTGTQRARVLEWFGWHGPETDTACANSLGMSGSSQRPRRIELVRDGYLRHLDNAGSTGRQRAARWVCTAKGFALLRERENGRG